MLTRTSELRPSRGRSRNWRERKAEKKGILSDLRIDVEGLCVKCAMYVWFVYGVLEGGGGLRRRGERGRGISNMVPGERLASYMSGGSVGVH